MAKPYGIQAEPNPWSCWRIYLTLPLDCVFRNYKEENITASKLNNCIGLTNIGVSLIMTKNQLRITKR